MKLMENRRISRLIMVLFLAMEAVLYGLILTSRGKWLIWSEYISIILCFLFVLLHFQEKMRICGLALTVCADFCLVICVPIQQLWGMVFFLGAQICYGVLLHRQGLSQWLLWARLGLSVAVETVAVLVLGDHADALALVSMLYYANLIMNMICAF